jgi:hypothetical protein
MRWNRGQLFQNLTFRTERGNLQRMLNFIEDLLKASNQFIALNYKTLLNTKATFYRYLLFENRTLTLELFLVSSRSLFHRIGR